MKFQYRIASEANWQSMFGRGIMVLSNPSGSGRKLTIRSFEVQTNSNVLSTGLVSKATLIRCDTIVGGEDMAVKALAFDSNNTIPSTVKVFRGGSPSEITGTVIKAFNIAKFSLAYGTGNRLNTHRSWGTFGGLHISGDSASPIEAVTVNQNESVALYISTLNATCPIRVSATVSINGVFFVWEYVTNTTPYLNLFGIQNTSTDVVKIISLSVQEVGAADTPYLRLVPVGQVHQDDEPNTSYRILTAMPMDSNYPTLTQLKAYCDVGFIPFGVPENYMTDTTTGTPRGFNYLHTKDFNGPTFKAMFPEISSISGVNNLGHHLGFLNRDIGLLGSVLVINPGEGVALVSSAETAVGGASYSGWPSLSFACQIDSEPQASPFLTLTNLQNPTEVRIYDAGTTTELTGAENITGGTFSWNYDPDVVSSVDISILSLGYQNVRLKALPLGLTDSSIPIQQQVDRQYLNP